QTVMADHLAGRPGTGLGVSYLAAARGYVAKHLHEAALDVHQVAAALEISPRHLSRLFAAEGLTVSEYIRSCRLRGAYADLGNPALGRLGVAAIAYKWGFVSQAHFSRVFKQQYGLTPKEARAGV